MALLPESKMLMQLPLSLLRTSLMAAMKLNSR